MNQQFSTLILDVSALIAVIEKSVVKFEFLTSTSVDSVFSSFIESPSPLPYLLFVKRTPSISSEFMSTPMIAPPFESALQLVMLPPVILASDLKR